MNFFKQELIGFLHYNNRCIKKTYGLAACDSQTTSHFAVIYFLTTLPSNFLGSDLRKWGSYLWFMRCPFACCLRVSLPGFQAGVVAQTQIPIFAQAPVLAVPPVFSFLPRPSAAYR